MHLPSFSHGLGEQETKPFTSLGTIVSKASRHKRMDPKQRCQSIFGVFTIGLILNHDILHSSMVHFRSSVLESLTRASIRFMTLSTTKAKPSFG